MRRHITSLALVGIVAGGAWVSTAQAVLPGVNDPSFELEPVGPLADSGGVNHWSSFGVNSPWAITAAVAHTGTQSVMNTDPSGFSLLYGYQTTSTPADILGQKFDYSFWVYYDPTMPGQAPATDNVGYDISARDDLNDFAADASGTITANTLLPQTWTQFSGVLDVTSPNPTSDPVDRLGMVLIAPVGTFFADDFSMNAEVTPEPMSLGLLGLGAVGLLTRRRRV